MSRKYVCRSYKFYIDRASRTFREKTHIAACDQGVGHEGKHRNEELGMEWE